MLKASLAADREFTVGELDRRVFGTFVEHMGRAVYGGIFEPGHATADERGFRGDVLELTRELGATLVRYPGGNFVSGYDWEDGVGPRAERPVRLDLAWGSTETNRFGTNEFMEWCRAANVEPMLAVNTGTRGADAARRLVEYCNHPGGTRESERRRAHGVENPHGVKLWCIGNEMDGPWQIGHKTAAEYGRLAQETAKVMRWVDPGIQLAACGSSNRQMPTFGAWEYEVLEHCFDEVDFISLHQYFRNETGDLREYFTVLEDLDAFIAEVAAIADAVAAQRRSQKRIMLSLDEWNVWYRTHVPEHLRKPGWPEAPKLIEEVYDFADALVVGGALITMLNRADRVRVACLAQLVNVIGPIMTETGGPAWRQTIFHPFALTARHARGMVLRTQVECDTFAAGGWDAAPYLLASAVFDPESDAITLLALNRHATEEIELAATLRGFSTGGAIKLASELHHRDPGASNRVDAPAEVAPAELKGVTLEGETLRATLKPLSWNVLVIAGS